MKSSQLYLSISILLLISLVSCKKFTKEDKPEWAKKDIRDFNDADMERLLEQWEEDEEPLEEDELPEYLRPAPTVDMSKIDPSNPEAILQQTKKGRTVMMFVSVTENPTKIEAEEITKLWQTSLWNSHIQAERYMIDDNRAIFMFKDGSQAWQAKDFLIEQERLSNIKICNR
ncbi:hypothetical protein PVAND_007570 [Polypedilum vanderplanki]|uniref:LDLR chaperone boca n=1 Tax=Polypedilum vanderplanki TaxID=319348 RepID=A0A9J6C732_POLVA|nr:hypothetical protein PVAND_007570 [Polypedilum vanderplanki]